MRPGQEKFTAATVALFSALVTTAVNAEETPAAVLDVSATEPTAAAELPGAIGTAASRETQAIRVAVYEMQAREVPTRISAIVTNNLVVELRKLQRVSAIGMDEVKDMLTHEENKQMLGCDEESCLAEIAGALGVDELITGSLSTVGGSSVLNLRRINMTTARVVGTVDNRLEPGDGEEFLAAVGPAIEKLYPEYPLKPGLERGVPDEVALRLNPPPLPTWLFWTTSGVAAALAIASGGATVMAGMRYGTYNETAAASVPPGTAVSAGVLKDIEGEAVAWDIARWSLLGVAGTLALAAGFEAIFTDWHGYRDAEL